MELSDGEEEDDSNWCTPGGIGRSASSPFPRVGVADRTNSGDSGMESRPDSSGGVGGLGVGSLGERSRGQSAAGSNGTGEKVGESHSERETLINGGTVHMYSLYVVCICVIVHIVHVYICMYTCTTHTLLYVLYHIHSTNSTSRGVSTESCYASCGKVLMYRYTVQQYGPTHY